MKSISRHYGLLSELERLPSSRYGNPRYRARVGGVSFVTRPDASVAYSLPNYVGKPVAVTIGSHYGRATLALICISD